MDTFLILLPFLAALAVVLSLTLRRVRCLDCGETLPLFISPFQKTRRMWRVGGYLCANCGCETNMAGQKVTEGTPIDPNPMARIVTTIGLLVGFGLLGIGALLVRPVAQPPMVVQPQVLVQPQQAPQTPVVAPTR